LGDFVLVGGGQKPLGGLILKFFWW